MLNLKAFLQGKKEVVEPPKKRPVGRPKKQAKIEDELVEAIPDLGDRLGKMAKPVEVKDAPVEVADDGSDSSFVECLVEQLAIDDDDFQDANESVIEEPPVVKREVVEEPPVVKNEFVQGSVAVKREMIEASPPAKKVKKELIESSPAVKQESLAPFVAALASPPVKDKTSALDLSPSLVGLGFSPIDQRMVKQLTFSEVGKLGAKHGIKGAEFGRLGGRRVKDKVKVEQGLVQKNSLKRVVKRANDNTFTIAAKLDMCSLVEKCLPLFEAKGLSVNDVYVYLQQQTGRTKAQIELAHTKKEKWVEEEQRLQLGKGTNNTLRKQGHKQGLRFVTSKGVRAKGGGAKAIFEDLYPAIETYFKDERDNGRYIDSEDLVLEFESLLQALQAKLKATEEEQGHLSIKDELRLKRSLELLPKIQSKPSTREYWRDRLKSVVGARLLKPQRLLTLSLDEERNRVFETWKDYDFKMHMMCFGPIEWLQQHVQDPEDFRKNIKTTVLSFLDQVPLWVMPRAGKQLYGEWELRKKSGDKNPLENLLGSAGSWSQKTSGLRLEGDEDEHEDDGLAENVDDEEEFVDKKDFTQKRGVENEQADKYRITIEMQQDLFNWFDPSLEPICQHAQPMLILVGAHGRLSNIDDNHCFIKDEAFEYQGKPVLRKAGTSARALLKNWVKLRRENPVAREMLKKVEIMQQPSGFQDSIISKWRIEAMSEGGQRLTSRDLNASYLSESARKASYLSHEVCHFEGGKITAVIQPTDTDVAYSFKAACTVEQQALKRELRDKAKLENTACVLKCGPYEVLRVVYHAYLKLEQTNNEKQNLLRCLRRNGFLAYRPDFEQKTLKPVEGKLAEEMPQGNHRMPSNWIEQRYRWRDDAGVPFEADWSKDCGPGVKDVEDMVDNTQHGELGCSVKLACYDKSIKEPHIEFSGDVDISEELPDVVPASVELKAAVDTRRKEAIDQYLTTQAKKVESQSKKDSRAKIKAAFKELLPKWREDMRKLELSRKQLLEILVPLAGETNKKKRILEEAAELKAGTCKKNKQGLSTSTMHNSCWSELCPWWIDYLSYLK